jgi:hypothetical protein
MVGKISHDYVKVARALSAQPRLRELAMACMRRYQDRDTAAMSMLDALVLEGTTATADGAVFTRYNVRRAMRTLSDGQPDQGPVRRDGQPKR